MMAWVSPCFTVRSTPLRISLVELSASTVTCRSWISSVAMGDSGLLGDGDEHVVPNDLDGVYGHGPGGGQPGRLSGAQVEGGAVQPAFDRAALHLALGQRDVRVRADVVDREHLALGADHRDRDAVDLHPVRGVVRQLAQRADAGERGGGALFQAAALFHTAHQTEASNSTSIFAISRSSRS